MGTPDEVNALLLSRALGESSPRQLPLTRHEGLPDLWTEVGYRVGVEVGVEQGRYSEQLLNRMPKLSLACVDAWAAYKGYREHVTQEKLDGFLVKTKERLAPFGDRVKVIKGYSVEVAKQFIDGDLDFVYIDGNHTLQHVIADFAAWVPKVKRGGMICGHDYGRKSVGHVAEAVQAWTSAYGPQDWYVTTGEKTPSFLWVKR